MNYFSFHCSQVWNEQHLKLNLQQLDHAFDDALSKNLLDEICEEYKKYQEHLNLDELRKRIRNIIGAAGKNSAIKDIDAAKVF